MGERFRSWISAHKESDLWIGVSPASWRPEMVGFAHAALLDARAQIEGYVPYPKSSALDHAQLQIEGDMSPHPASEAMPRDGAGHEFFLQSFFPLPDDPDAPPVVRTMLRAGIAAGVGPMAAVAGAIAEYVGRAIVAEFGCEEVLVENGGDLWLSFVRPLTIAVFAGNSPLSGRFGIELAPSLSPCGLCTSSGTVGPSLSFGYADASAVLCADAALADAWATASCNAVQNAEDIEATLGTLGEHPEILGSLIVVGDRLGLQGRLSIRPLGQLWAQTIM
jgi:ApbE superfamily uncharacterized protein (UPF0280 family)